ncbi:hypothetical protein Tco_1164786 [Tanacetum coccineum]
MTNKYVLGLRDKKMEDEFYGLTVNGSDLKTYIRRFQELAFLCPNMVPNSEKLMEAFIGGLPQSIEGNVTASKPQTLKSTTIAHRLMDQIIKRNSDVQAFYAKELPISSPDPITPPAILTPSPQIHSPSSSSTTLSNSSRNQTCDLISPSSSVYTPTPPQIFEIGKCSVKMHLKHHEEQIEDILNYLDELSFHRIEKMEERRINGNELKTKLKEIRTQIIKLQKKRLGQKDKIAFAHYRISDLEQIIEKIQARHQTNQEDL